MTAVIEVPITMRTQQAPSIREGLSRLLAEEKTMTQKSSEALSNTVDGSQKSQEAISRLFDLIQKTWEGVGRCLGGFKKYRKNNCVQINIIFISLDH